MKPVDYCQSGGFELAKPPAGMPSANPGQLTQIYVMTISMLNDSYHVETNRQSLAYCTILNQNRYENVGPSV